ncbi:MAG: hypothetical protein ACC682_11710 [Gemmatimonadota bacterium]
MLKKSNTQTGRAQPPDRTPTGSGQGGFALALVMLALIGMTTLAMAGYLRSSTDYKINQNYRAATRAFYVSDAGRSQHLATGRMSSDTTTYSYSSGSVNVWAEPLISIDGAGMLYQLKASGTHNSPEGGTANRMTSSIVIWTPADLDINAAITAPAGLNKNGVAGSVSGYDQATTADCPTGGLGDVAGLQVPPGLFNQNGNGNSNGNNGNNGKGKGNSGNGGGNSGGGSVPPGFYGVPEIDSTQTAYEMTSNIDWQGMLDGSFVEPDYIVSVDGYPSFGNIGADEWPIILVDADSYSFNPPKSGRGTLIIQGDATFQGSFSWEGLVLIGGQLTSNGNNSIAGALVAGLNIQLGQTINAVDVGNGTWDYAYNSCNLLNALQSMGYAVEEPHTWLEIF